MQRFADGDRAAFDPLFAALWPVVHAFAHKLLGHAGHSGDAEDAAQEALVKVFARIVDYDPRRDGVSWALGIASYEVLTARKRRQRRREEPVGEAVAACDVEGFAITSELERVLQELVGDLPARDRLALAPLLAGEPGPTGETPRKRRLRAIERLRAAWRRAHG